MTNTLPLDFARKVMGWKDAFPLLNSNNIRHSIREDGIYFDSADLNAVMREATKFCAKIKKILTLEYRSVDELNPYLVAIQSQDIYFGNDLTKVLMQACINAVERMG